MVMILSVFLAAWAMHQAGLSFALGAFLMGMFLSGSRYSMQIEAYIEPYKGLLMSLFFVAVGMSIDLRSIAASPLAFVEYCSGGHRHQDCRHVRALSSLRHGRAALPSGSPFSSPREASSALSS